MRDLAAATGLPRQAIHFYIQQGLVPPGRKTGRNMAFYGQEHIERLHLVRRLQHERFLPLRAIKALLDEQDAAEFTETQRRFLRELRDRLGPRPGTRGTRQGDPAGPPSETTDPVWRPASRVAEDAGASPGDVARLRELGLVRSRPRDDETDSGVDGFEIPGDDVWLVGIVAELRAAGFTAERGFAVDDLMAFQEAIDRLLRWETELITRRLDELCPEEAAAMVDRALPLLETLLVRSHAARLESFLEAL